MKRLLKRIVLRLLYSLTKEEEGRDYVDLSRHELTALAVKSLVGIDHSLSYMVKRSIVCEGCEEEEESAIPYPENNRPREMIV